MTDFSSKFPSFECTLTSNEFINVVSVCSPTAFSHYVLLFLRFILIVLIYPPPQSLSLVFITINNMWVVVALEQLCFFNSVAVCRDLSLKDSNDVLHQQRKPKLSTASSVFGGKAERHNQYWLVICY